MPHPGTHITTVQLLAASSALNSSMMTSALGGELAEPLKTSNVPDVSKHRYACFGAIGPDLLYFMLDSGPEAQAVQTAVIKLLAPLRSFQRFADTLSAAKDKVLVVADEVDACDVLAMIDGIVDQTSKTIEMALGILTGALKSLVVGGLGLNLFSLFPSPAQAGQPPNEWYWADHLHYVRSGQFTRNLLDLAFLNPKYSGRPELKAYALGYLTHVIADVIGHPYVNQIVGGPFRLHRQRHTLVENFIDGWVWPYAHTPRKGPDTLTGDSNPLTGRAWLDRIRADAEGERSHDRGAEYFNARLDELIDVGGGPGFGTAIDAALDGLADGATDAVDAVFDTDVIGVQDDALFMLWADMFLAALHKTYDTAPNHPKLLAGDGFPTASDLAAAYATCLALLGVSTGGRVEKPQFPPLDEDALKFLEELLDAIGDALDKLGLPVPNLGSSFSLKDFFSALVDWARSVVEAAIGIIGAVIDTLKKLCAAAVKLTGSIVRTILYFLQLPLWAAYEALNRVMEMRAYAQPSLDTVDERPDLWRAKPNRVRRSAYPIMEDREADNDIKQDQLFTDLEPSADPSSDPTLHLERATIREIGQDFPSSVHPAGTPHDLLFTPVGAIDLFGPDGPRSAPPPTTSGATIAPDYGGIVPNCRSVIERILAHAAKPGVSSVVPPGMTLHDYNLDGDRGIGWTAWTVDTGVLRPAFDTDTDITTRPLGG